jgi:hypothetical protein
MRAHESAGEKEITEIRLICPEDFAGRYVYEFQYSEFSQ